MMFILASINIVTNFANADDANAIEHIAGKYKPSVVKIYSYSGTKTSIGSGFIIKDNGEILTNFHVIKDSDTLKIKFLLCTTVYDENIKVLAVDTKRDIALLKIDNYSDIEIPAPCTSEKKLMLQSTINPMPIKEGSLKDGTSFVIISNPANEGQSFVHNSTPLGSERYIDEIVPKRKALIKTDPDYRYQILTFNNSIKAGSSGAPLIELKSKQVIGMATGSTGADEFSAFAINGKLIKEIASKNYSNAMQVKLFLETYNIKQKIKSDPYYPTLTHYSGIDLNKNKISISGFIINDANEPLKKVKVDIYDKLATNLKYSTYTDETGNYNLSIPYSEYSNWQLQLNHPMHETPKTKNIGIIKENISHNAKLYPRKDFSVKTDFFYANPPLINIDSEQKTFELVAEEMDGNFFTRKNIRWILCTSNSNCSKKTSSHDWLNISPYTGQTAIDEDENEDDIIYLTLNKPEEKLPTKKQNARLVFKANIENKERYAVINAKHGSDIKYFYVHGFVFIKGAGIPAEGNIRIMASSYDNSPLGIGSVKSDGYFKIKIPVPEQTTDDLKDNDNYATINFKIVSTYYRFAKNTPPSVDYRYSKKINIEVVPKS